MLIKHQEFLKYRFIYKRGFPKSKIGILQISNFSDYLKMLVPSF